jgi:hypothetical protein
MSRYCPALVLFLTWSSPWCEPASLRSRPFLVCILAAGGTVSSCGCPGDLSSPSSKRKKTPHVHLPEARVGFPILSTYRGGWGPELGHCLLSCLGHEKMIWDYILLATRKQMSPPLEDYEWAPTVHIFSIKVHSCISILMFLISWNFCCLCLLPCFSSSSFIVLFASTSFCLGQERVYCIYLYNVHMCIVPALSTKNL